MKLNKKNIAAMMLGAFLTSTLVPVSVKATEEVPVAQAETPGVEASAAENGVVSNKNTMSSYWLMVKDFQVEGGRAIAGEDGNLLVTLTNTNSQYGILNILLEITGNTNDVMLSEETSNQFFVEYLPAGESITVSIPFHAADNALGERYFKVDLHYLFAEEKLMASNSSTIHFPIYRSSLATTDFAFDESTNEITLNYMNNSKNNIYDAAVIVSGDSIESAKTEIGNVNAGEAGTISLSGTFNNEGSQNLKVSYSYVNEKGETVQSEVEKYIVNAKTANGITDDSIIKIVSPEERKQAGIKELFIILFACFGISAFSFAMHQKQSIKSRVKKKTL